MTTAQQIIEAGYARSTLNDPGKLAGDLELIGHLNRRYQLRCAELALAAGDNWLSRQTISFVGSPATLSLPADVIDLNRLEAADGSKVHLIPNDEKDRAWHVGPSVIRVGNTIVTRGKSGDPGTGFPLTVHLLDAPVALVALASVLDPRYPARHEPLLILDLSIYLSIKDEGRDMNDWTQLVHERDDVEKKFYRELFGADYAKEHPSLAQDSGRQS
jgi:hypothetical protein